MIGNQALAQDPGSEVRASHTAEDLASDDQTHVLSLLPIRVIHLLHPFLSLPGCLCQGREDESRGVTSRFFIALGVSP